MQGGIPADFAEQSSPKASEFYIEVNEIISN